VRQLKRTTLYFFGDSIFFGQGVSPHKTWVTRLSQRVSDAFAGVCELVVQNPSVNGNTTRLALERMAYDVQAHRPDVLVVQFGMNDCNVWQTDSGRPRVSSAAFAANLAEIIERGRKFGTKEVILGVNHSTTRVHSALPNVDHTYDEANRSYNAIIRRVAAEQHTRLVDLEKAFDDRVGKGNVQLSDLLFADELHLSELGHDIYLAEYYPHVEAALRAVAGISVGKATLPAAAEAFRQFKGNR
jgi:lysophospholipase L1-like esterase